MSTKSQSSIQLTDAEIDLILLRSHDSIPTHGEMLSCFHEMVNRKNPIAIWRRVAYGVSFACLASVALMMSQRTLNGKISNDQLAALVPLAKPSQGLAQGDGRVATVHHFLSQSALPRSRSQHRLSSANGRGLSLRIPIKPAQYAMRYKTVTRTRNAADGVLIYDTIDSPTGASTGSDMTLYRELSQTDNSQNRFGSSSEDSFKEVISLKSASLELNSNSRAGDSDDEIQIVDEERGFVSQGMVSSARGERTDEVSINIVSEADQTEKRDLP